MLKTLFGSVGALLLGMAVPAHAVEVLPETVVQTDNRHIDRGFDYFDSSLGSLLSVRLEITPDFQRAFQAIYPGVLDTASVSWDASTMPYCYGGTCTDLISRGQIDLSLSYSEDIGSYEYFVVDFTGDMMSLDLNVEGFINPSIPGERLFMTPIDPGLYDESLVGIFQIADGGRIKNATNIICMNSFSGCDRSMFRLIYTYAPGGVPEPATWALMILGFGGIGATMRARRCSRHQRLSSL